MAFKIGETRQIGTYCIDYVGPVWDKDINNTKYQKILFLKFDNSKPVGEPICLYFKDEPGYRVPDFQTEWQIETLLSIHCNNERVEVHDYGNLTTIEELKAKLASVTAERDKLAEELAFCKTINLLLSAFPKSFINHANEFIAHKEANAYFRLTNCETELDVKCKVLEWLSRAASCAYPFSTQKKNDVFHDFMLDGINTFLGTAFTEDDMEQIYVELGNGLNHEKTIRFIELGYDMSILDSRKNISM